MGAQSPGTESHPYTGSMGTSPIFGETANRDEVERGTRDG
jgi:hypothetical protein